MFTQTLHGGRWRFNWLFEARFYKLQVSSTRISAQFPFQALAGSYRTNWLSHISNCRKIGRRLLQARKRSRVMRRRRCFSGEPWGSTPLQEPISHIAVWDELEELLFPLSSPLSVLTATWSPSTANFLLPTGSVFMCFAEGTTLSVVLLLLCNLHGRQPTVLTRSSLFLHHLICFFSSWLPNSVPKLPTAWHGMHACLSHEAGTCNKWNKRRKQIFSLLCISAEGCFCLRQDSREGLRFPHCCSLLEMASAVRISLDCCW